MKLKYCQLSLACVCVTLTTLGQGTFIYDQQSSDETQFLDGGAALGQQPLGQGFTPSLTSINFIRVYLYSSGLGPGTFYLNLRSGSISGAIVDSTTPVTLTNGFSGVVNFFFSDSIPVAPNTTYFFQPVVQSGGGWGTLVATYNYPGGAAVVNGAILPNSDFWFREGINIPEPAAGALMGLGLLVLRFRRRNE